MAALAGEQRGAFRCARPFIIGVVCLAACAPLPLGWRQARAATAFEESTEWSRADSLQPHMAAASWDREVGRRVRRTERFLGRAASSLWLIARSLVWVAGWTLMFLLWTAAVAALDWRMLRDAFSQPRAVARELTLGPQVFLRLVRDWEAPALARMGLVAAWLYWVVPLDIMPDDVIPAGLLDDAGVSVFLGKAFLWLCPAQLVQRAAERVVTTGT